MEHLTTRLTARPEWRSLAACHGRHQEMEVDDGEGIQWAKKICADCPVTACCFAYAERLSDTLGHDQAQGVWGGLTQRERDTLAILDRPPELCPSCGLLCVPVGSTTELCNVCNPKPTINWVEYRPLVEPLIAT